MLHAVLVGREPVSIKLSRIRNDANDVGLVHGLAFLKQRGPLIQ